MISTKLRPFGTTIFSEMTRLAQAHGAINLSQGFPDFEGPPELVEAAVRALRSGDNQYARSLGQLDLVRAISRHQERHYGLEYDPQTEVVVFSGATEGIASSLLGLLDPGDEVILFEPFYDSYPAAIAMAGAKPRYCTLRFPDFELDLDDLAGLFNSKTRVLLLNTPHNPTGKVFGAAELAALAELCRRHDVVVVTDEVYEHLAFPPAVHRTMAACEGMRDRTLVISSAGKTFSMTGWKIGWATGPAKLVAAAQAAHQFVTFATATPLQAAVAQGLDTLGEEFHAGLERDYRERRDFLAGVLEEVGFSVSRPDGTYFILADFRDLFDGDDRAFVRKLIAEVGVAAIPPSVFYRADPEAGRRLVRFAFCKQMSTLREAAEKLRRMRK